jgi:hypothetical protein
MATVQIKISQLKELTGSAITGDDYFPVVDSGSGRTYRISLDNISDYSMQSVTDLIGSGSDRQILFNIGGEISGSPGLTYNYTNNSVVNGFSSSVSGTFSHAEGGFTYASGVYAHAEGLQTIAYGTASHVEGYHTTAYGNYQSVVGTYNATSSRNTSSLFIVGGGTSEGTRKDALQVNTTNIVVNGDISMSGTIYKTGAEYIPASSSYSSTSSYSYLSDITDDITNHRIGISMSAPLATLDVNGDIWNSTSDNYFIGNTNNVTYFANTTGSSGKVAIGHNNPVSKLDVKGNISSSGITASAATIKGNLSNGFVVVASGTNCHAEGWATTANGTFSHAEGVLSTTQGTFSHAEGASTVTYGGGSHTEGLTTMTYISASYSHAEGWVTITSGSFSHTEGVQTITYTTGSHAEGYNTTASGLFSHAEGVQTTAYGSGSCASGFGTIASGSYQAVMGTYNSVDSSSLFIIGNGTTNALRSNVLLVTTASINPTGFISPPSSSTVPALTGSMFYSGSKLFIYTGLGTAQGFAGWQTASLGG